MNRLLVFASVLTLCVDAQAAAPPSQRNYSVNLGSPPFAPSDMVPAHVPMWIDTTNTTVNAFGQPTPASDQSPLPVSVKGVSGSTGSGADASGSAPAVGNVLATVTVVTPGAYYVQNQSAATLQVVYDNGTSGTPSTQLLAPGAGAGQQGADTSPPMPWFTGRIRVAGPAGSQFMARSN